MSAAANPGQRTRALRRARQLAWIGNAWHMAEFVVALAAGIAAGSVALIAFGVDSLIELAAGTIIIWRLAGRRRDSELAEQQAQRLLAVTFLALMAYVLVGSTRTLISGTHPGVSPVGIGLAAVTAAVMPLLAAAKARVGRELGSTVTERESGQNRLCGYLSVALLVGLGANAILGWWWADPAAAVVIGVMAAKEGIEAWRGQPCGCPEVIDAAPTGVPEPSAQDGRAGDARDGASLMSASRDHGGGS